MKEELVEMIEIWRKSDKDDATAVITHLGEPLPLKIMAIIVNGYPVHIEDGIVIEKTPITKEGAEQLQSRKLGSRYVRLSNDNIRHIVMDEKQRAQSL